MGLRVRATVLALAAVVGLACEGPRHAEAARTPFEQMLVDSAAADSAAFATLPPALSSWLDVRAYLAPERRAELPFAECRELDSPDAGLQRLRLQLRLPDATAVVLYAVADRGSGALDRVEFIRRTAGNGQRGLVWDAERNRTYSSWWREGSRGLSRRAERGEIPRGGPVPLALRSLGRQLFTLPCNDPPADPADSAELRRR